MIRTRPARLLPFFLLVLVSLAAGCDLPLYQASVTSTEVFATSDQPKIVVETFNGSIDISNGQADEVVAEVTKRASGFDQNSAEANLDKIEITMAAENDEIHIRIKRIGHVVGDCGAAVVIAAPPNSVVELKSSNGYVVCEGMRGSVEARTSNAKVDVVEASGRIDVRSSNGPILIEGEDLVVDAGTSNSGVRVRGTLAEGEHELSTSNGPIDVVLPEGSQFAFKASTSNGSIDCDFDYDEQNGSKRRRRLNGVVGRDPKVELELTTSNSSIDIRPGEPRRD